MTRAQLLTASACAVLALVLVPTRPALAATTISIPSSIDASGKQDVTTQLQAILSKIPAGATIEFPAQARFRVEGVLRLTGLRGVTIEGNGATLFAQTDGHDVLPPLAGFRAHWPRLRQHISVRGADGLTLRDLEVQGPNTKGDYVPALEGQAGIAVGHSKAVTIDNVSVRGTYGDGVYVANKSSDVIVRNSSFDAIGRQGVAVVNASGIVIANNHFAHISRSVVDLEPTVPGWSVVGVHIQDNQVGDYGNFLLAAGGAGPNVTDVWLERNRVTGGNGLTVFAGQPRWAARHGLHIIANESDVAGRVVPGTGRAGVMQLTNLDGVEIIGNRQAIAGGAAAVELAAVCGLTMHDNTFTGASSTQAVTAPCGAPLPIPSRSGAIAGGGQTTAGAASRSASGAHGGSTNSAMLVVGAVAGALMLLILAALAIRERRRSPG